MSSERPSTLGAHLARMDQMLRDLQTQLAPEPEREPVPVFVTAGIPDPPLPPAEPPPIREPPPAEPPPIREPPPPPPPIPAPALDAGAQIQALTELSERLLASMRELLAGYERVLVPRAHQRPEPAGVTLSAGPFATIEALHEFEAALSHLHGVREVVVRGCEGTDRAIIDVRLGGSNA